MNIDQQFRKSLYYLDKGKEREALKTLETILPLAKQAEKNVATIQISIVLAHALFLRGERFTYCQKLLHDALELSHEEWFDDMLDEEIQQAKKLVAEIEQYFAETGQYFQAIDLEQFWADVQDKSYRDRYPTKQIVHQIEQHLTIQLPASYTYLMRHAGNGGIPRRYHFPLPNQNGYITIQGFMPIGFEAPNAICGTYATQFWQQEWQYPNVGLVIADTPSGGHELIFLDYRSPGEPAVVLVDQENDFAITPLAANFEAFICGLKSDAEMAHLFPEFD
ncbi:SMI1/KNR4 family protein [Listeria costaricensis]|uniref:SMI1/KNR4 family protein n=1 Tax=Listeria costaricensis TaxID=2026604 RepID=UPI0013C4A1EB|nr:SMI1/KNR4 family protein [Listeria costaricensis]